jgi:hypothetical protein
MFFNSGKQVVIRLMTPLRMSYEESYVRAFPFNKMVDGMLDLEMIEDILPIVKEVVEDQYRVNLIINNRVDGNAPLIAQMVVNKLHREKQPRML